MAVVQPPVQPNDTLLALEQTPLVPAGTSSVSGLEYSVRGKLGEDWTGHGWYSVKINGPHTHVIQDMLILTRWSASLRHGRPGEGKEAG